MRCANKDAEERLHVSVQTPKQKPQQLMSHRLLKRLSLCHLVMQALVMKTLMSSQSMSSVSHTLLIRKTDPYRQRSNPSRLPSVAWMMLCVVASDESDEPSPKRRRSRSRDSGANSGVGSPMDTTSQRGASPSVGTSQEERDRNVLRLAPETKAWMPSKSVMDHLSATTSDRYRTRLFDSSRIHHLDPSA
uniref:Uncharacterized protein n=1 Tax=Peronospora matthiolae TaxID=2874970 RepID=A0AAV1UZF8_9STRA